MFRMEEADEAEEAEREREETRNFEEESVPENERRTTKEDLAPMAIKI